MEFEWDDDKYQSNLAKHGVSFRLATRIFKGPILTEEDVRRDYGERRFISIGVVQGICLVVVHTERDGITRIISAWLGGRNDKKRYDAHYDGGTGRDG